MHLGVHTAQNLTSFYSSAYNILNTWNYPVIDLKKVTVPISAVASIGECCVSQLKG
jgi:hypothetical protein